MSTNGALVDLSCLLTGLRIYRQLKLEKVGEYENRLYQYYMTNRKGSEWKFDVVYDETTKELGLDIDWYSRDNKINPNLINRFDGLILPDVAKDLQMIVNCDVKDWKKSLDCEYSWIPVNGSQDVRGIEQEMDFNDSSIFLRASFKDTDDTFKIQFEKNRLDRSKQYMIIVNFRNLSIARTECRGGIDCLQWQFIQDLSDELYAHLDSTVFYSLRGKVSQEFDGWQGFVLWFVFDGQPFYCFQPESTTGPLSPEVSRNLTLVGLVLTFHLFQCSTRDRLKTVNSYNICETTTLAPESTEWTKLPEAGQTTGPGGPDSPKSPDSPDSTEPSTIADSKTIAPTKLNTPQTTVGKEGSKLWIILVILFVILIIIAIIFGLIYGLRSGGKGPEEEAPSPAKSPPKSPQREYYDHLTRIKTL